MNKKHFIAVWKVKGNHTYCNIECTRYELENDVLRLWDMDLFVGQFDLGFVELAYFTEAA